MVNWKTTAAGIAAMVMSILPTIIPSLPPEYATVASGVLAGLGLIFAKDHNVTGGTVKQ